MGRFRFLGALAAGLICASASEAAVYTYSGTVAEGTSQRFTFQVDGPVNLSAFISMHYTWYFPIPVPDGHGGVLWDFITSEQGDVSADCTGTLCLPTGAGPGTVELFTSINTQGLSVYVENRAHSFFDCDGLTEFAICGYIYKPPVFSFSFLSGEIIESSMVTGGVPEPATWAMMIAGFGLVGAGLRRRRLQIA